ncbi:chondroitin sulfate proteoglycan 4-like [Oratosquilla oratoria]|uniref:chondroitin sulfate proteoglycan 4-like n=1 Tax=Oratosquilla oratoria TaxID=337810 RepID=UPI003F75D1B3
MDYRGSILSLLIVLCYTAFATVNSASFFGASYISLPLQEARSTTEIHLRLKTHRADSLLLLATGKTDYCLVLLEGGALRVRVNLGAGETELSSPARLRLNDLLWHNVAISRTSAHVTLTVDSIHTTRLTLPGRFHELNVHYGVFVGGLGDFTEVFLGLLDNFRGCLEQVNYNGIDILREAREAPKTIESFGVDFTECADEFEAPPDAPLSLVLPGAYVALDQAFQRTGGSVALQVKTQQEAGLLMYNTGPPSRSDFVALELVDGRPRLVLDKGNGPLDLNSSVYVSDGSWHGVKATFNPTYLELRVDDVVSSQPAHLGENKFFDLSGYVYVGGIELNRQARAVTQGVRSGDTSLAGCIQDLKIGEQTMTLRDPRVTQGIRAQCAWAYPCLKSPCVDGATCLQEGTDGFKCECDQPLCVRQNFTTGYKVYTKTTLPFVLEVLSLTPVEVLEGQQALVTSHHLRLVLDYEKYGVRESGVLFHVIVRPQRGHLDVDLWQRPPEKGNVFTLLDLNNDRVTYVHDGSETSEDSIVLELELSTTPGYILPSYLQDRHRFVLPVSVVAQNDAPIVVLGQGKVLRLAEGTRKALTTEIITAQDPDTPAKDIRFTVLNLKADNEGYIENSKMPGKSIHTFTQEDLEAGHITYFHRGNRDAKIALKVSDGIESGSTAFLRVAAFELKVFIVNNTGLFMTHGSAEIIRPMNLSFSTNAPEQDLDIRFNVIGGLRHGAVQRLRGNGRWQTVNQFINKHLEKEKVRYEHTGEDEPEEDEMVFKVSVDETEFPKEYSFRIKFIAVTVEVLKNAELLIDHIQESFISDGFLLSATQPHPTPPQQIHYTLLSLPRYGALFLSSGDLTHHQQLQVDSRFTQRDISKGRIKYKLHRKSYSPLHDTFRFQVEAQGRSSKEQVFHIRHTPPPVNANIVIERIDVMEGRKQKITKKYLKIEAPDIKNLIYNVTSGPEHGVLSVVDETLVAPRRTNTTFFTSKEINNDWVVYEHDDSESSTDEIHFVALPEDPTLDFQYVGVLNIRIVPRNDNKPVRAFEKVLNVVTQSQRVVTSRDLLYIDPDVSTTPDQIQYTTRKIPNGRFYQISDRNRPIYVFTQEDINQRRILFRHEGPSYGKAVISVTDGDLSTTGVLEIVASDPFVEIVNNSGIIVPRSREAVITTGNLSVETNLNARSSSVVYKVLRSPRFGMIQMEAKEAPTFTEEDLAQGRVRYRNNGDTTIRDDFGFEARVGNTKTEGIFEIKVYPESYWEPLLVLHNKSIKVEEGSKVTLDQASLKVMHPHIPPSDVTYVILQGPQYGYLEVEIGTPSDSSSGSQKRGSRPREVRVFDQALVNEGRVRYTQTKPNVTSDSFTFDVTNGIVSLRRLRYVIEVIPNTIYLSPGRLTVREGGTATLLPKHLRVLTSYYADRIDQYLVASKPSTGTLQVETRPGVRLETFRHEQLQQGVIKYVHDGSETLEDEFSLVALSGHRQSAPAALTVKVEAVNDEAPFVVNNTGLELWEGATVPLTTQVLAVRDLDTPPEELRYSFTTPDTGYVALARNLTQQVSTFTQEDLEGSRVFFTHTGSLEGGFKWQVTDGVHSTTTHLLTVVAKALHLTLVRNTLLHVFPMMQQTLSSTHLLAVTNDFDPQRSVMYVVRKQPLFGRLLLEQADGSMIPVENFTQRDLNDSLVVFEHTQPFTDLSAKDMFLFDVETPFAEPLKNNEFLIDISVTTVKSGGLEKYLGLSPLTVEEGGSATLGTRNLNVSAVVEFIMTYNSDSISEKGSSGSPAVPRVRTEVVGTPMHGALLVGDRNISVGDLLYQKDIDRGRVRYQHDHSDSRADYIGLCVYLEGDDREEEGPQESAEEGETSKRRKKGKKNRKNRKNRENDITSGESSSSPPTDILLFNGTLNITITPVNDQPFRLITTQPEMSVVQRQSRIITTDLLRTIDDDNLPDEIIYEVMSGPDKGKLVFVDNYTRSANAFSQMDVDTSKVMYVHDGTNGSAKFYFKVSDGKHKPKYTVFTIHVVPLTLKMENHTAIPIVQSSTVTYLRSAHIAAVTNGNPDHIFYNVTRLPRHGRLYMNDQPVHTFGQVNINKEEVLYMQINMNEMRDSFFCNIWTYDKILEDVEIKVEVEPLVRRRPLVAVVGTRTHITLDHLDASRLASQTVSNPMYRIKKPKFGHVKKMAGNDITAGRRDTATLRRLEHSLAHGGRSHEVHQFSHEEVRAGVIYYISRNINLALGEPLYDVLHFVVHVTAPNVQPAQGTLKIDLVSSLEGIKDAMDVTRTEEVEGDFVIAGDDVGGEAVGKSETLPPSVRGSNQPQEPRMRDRDISSVSMNPDHILIVGVGVGVVTLALLIIIAVKCATRKKDSKSPKKPPPMAYDPSDVTNIPPPLPTDTRPNSYMTDDFSDLDVAATTTLPRHDAHHHHHHHHHHHPSSPRPPRHKLRVTNGASINGGSGVKGGSLGLAAHLSESDGSTWPHESSREVSPAVPQCKVIPLAPPEASPPHDLYPYGADNEQVEEWGLYESQPITARTTNPMLRKNQYWV